MRVIRFDGEFIRVITDAPDPALPPGEALIHPLRVLATPADAAAASPGKPAAVLGHQFVGIVRKINPAPSDGVGGAGAGRRPSSPLAAAREALVGRRVVGSPVIVCTNCDMCRAGLPGHCRARRVMGLAARDGCFADLFALPLSNLCPVPDAVDTDRAVFAHLAASAAQTLQMLRGSAARSQYITVIGDSALALLTAQVLAVHNKAARLLYTRDDRASLCEKWGIKHRARHEPGRRQDQDIVIECSGSGAGLRLAMQLVRPRGTIMLKSPLAGEPFPPGQTWPQRPADEPSPLDLTPAIVNEVQITGCRDASIADGLGLLCDHEIDVAGLVARRCRLDDAPAAIAAAAPPDSLAIMLEP